MNRHQKTRSESTGRSSVGATPVIDGLAGPPAAGAGSRKRSIAKWILFAILILPW
jgi:hypothetical protein